jgi:hypothetical protein
VFGERVFLAASQKIAAMAQPKGTGGWQRPGTLHRAKSLRGFSTAENCSIVSKRDYAQGVDPIRTGISEYKTPSTVRWLVYGALAVPVGIILLLALAASQTSDLRGAARTTAEIHNLQAAIMQFNTIYGYFPVAESTVQQCRDSDSEFTFGIPVSLRFSRVAPDNAELMDFLLAREKGPNRELQNSRKIKFLDLKMSQSTDDSELGPDGVFRDPWGHPYVITLDLNGDSYCEDALYSRPAVSSKTIGKPGSLKFESSGTGPDAFRLKTPIMIWSMGPDGKADPNVPADEGVNADNILSWD